MEEMISYLIKFVAQFLAVTVIIMVHEFAHAFVANKCGDPTAKWAGRMTLNPLKHFDLLGIVMFTLVGFGWAKPVPVNPDNFNNRRAGSFWTSAAGIIANYITAFLFYPIFLLTFEFVLPLFAGKYMWSFLFYLTLALYSFSLSFCVFNLLPFYPLDGFRMVDALSKKRGKVYWFLRKYGYYILLALMFISLLAERITFFAYIDVLGYVMSFAMNIFGKPISLFWDWIFRLIF